MPGQRKKELTVALKLEAIDAVKGGESKTSVAKKMTEMIGHNVQQAQIRDWIKHEAQLRNTPRPEQAVQAQSQRAHDRESGKHPEMERRLYEEFLLARAKKWPVNNDWLIRHGRTILDDLEPGHSFGFSRGWLRGFTKRKRIAPRKGARASKKTDEQRKAEITEFLKFTRTQCWAKKYELSEIGNVDQSGVMVLTDKGMTYEVKGTRNVEIAPAGLVNFRCTMVLFVSADGQTRAKPLVIFKPDDGMTQEDRDHEASQIKDCLVRWQENAWATAEIMAWWAEHAYASATAYPNQGKPRLLVLDTFKGHLGRSSPFYQKLKALKTIRAVIPGGATGDLQPLDLDFNKAMKLGLKQKEQDWMSTGTNEADYFSGQHTTKHRRILFGNWVGEVFVKVGRDKSDSMRNVFRRVGISLPTDGSQDNQFRISRYPNLRMPPPPLAVIDLDEDDVEESNVDADAMREEENTLRESDETEDVFWFDYAEVEGAVIKEEELDEDAFVWPNAVEGNSGKGVAKKVEVVSVPSDDDDDVVILDGKPRNFPSS